MSKVFFSSPPIFSVGIKVSQSDHLEYSAVGLGVGGGVFACLFFTPNFINVNATTAHYTTEIQKNKTKSTV